jgi:hypothetical protein
VDLITSDDLEGKLEATDISGRQWGPIACGEHRSAAADEEPDGFQSGCEACEAQLESVRDSIRRESETILPIPDAEPAPETEDKPKRRRAKADA